ELHLEIIVDRLLREFHVKAYVGKPQVSYKESVASSARHDEEYVRQIGPRGQYARVVLEVEPGKKGSGVICLNGAAARLGEVGDILIIISYCEMEKEKVGKYKPKIVLVDKKNRPIK
ncbi:MAG: aspartate 1-decarboxylase, partial [candidate division Zixibacteria bacterium]|nr:aspartate 1-decarboxylase [candidate division Zixibacteria bacterium]